MSAPITFDNSYSRLSERFHQSQPLQPVQNPALIEINPSLAATLSIDEQWLTSEEALGIFSGNTLPEGATPIATVYAGYQFGHWNPQLGDGRALLLGEILTEENRFDLQLKGSGPTAYSRGGDGRSPLGPVIREYIVSEAMAALGVPTTRALAAVATGEQVYRETAEPGGILTRVASSHIRFGTFQYFSASQDLDSLRQLADYALARHYPEAEDEPSPYLGLLDAVIAKFARLIAQWQNLGFIHGVMNTDNMLICGETVDYGPCAFMDTFKQSTVYSAIDQQGRYAYQNQPSIAHWNLMTLAQALLPLIDPNEEAAIEAAKASLETFPKLFERAFTDLGAAKLGLTPSSRSAQLLTEFLSLLEQQELDYSLSFSGLKDRVVPEVIADDPSEITAWAEHWRQALLAELSVDEAKARLSASNPVIIPRNHHIEFAIQAAYRDHDFEPFKALNAAVTDPYNEALATSVFASAPADSERVQRTFCGT